MITLRVFRKVMGKHYFYNLTKIYNMYACEYSLNGVMLYNVIKIHSRIMNSQKVSCLTLQA